MLRQGAQRKHRCELERRSQTMPRSGGGPAAPLEEALPKRRLDHPLLPSKRLSQNAGLIFSSDSTICEPLSRCHVDSSQLILSCSLPSTTTSPLRFTQTFLLDMSTLMSRAVHFSTLTSTVTSWTDWFHAKPPPCCCCRSQAPGSPPSSGDALTPSGNLAAAAPPAPASAIATSVEAA
eukprot:CAMPEP_0179265798 /NCGR_PEP_ID=MMETSP0797-20121207/29089_1 /TAXON_ID=47934 /ORGANISM="Dinophysis acuminata, Strain DAEP01" /LENGTH=177 /DNA_ID=CAMNT_0020974017 /DNA_START=69 /DNA_END=598 /DNA_ORIENTATION=-